MYIHIIYLYIYSYLYESVVVTEAFFLFFASQSLHNRFVNKKQSGEVKGSVILPLFCLLHELHKPMLPPCPLSRPHLARLSTHPPIPSLCEQLHHGQKHIIFLCYHSNIIIHFEVFDFIEPYSTRFLYKYEKCFYVFLLLYNTCFMIMSCIP